MILNKKDLFIKITAFMLLGSLLVLGKINLVYADVDSIVVQSSLEGINYEYNLSQLLESQTQFYRGGDGVLYEDFDKLLKGQANKIISYHDTKNSYISVNSVMQAYTQAQRNEEIFNLDTFTQSMKAEKISVAVRKKNIKDGKLVLEGTSSNELEVISIE